MQLSLIVLIYRHSDAPVRRLARAGSALCPTVTLSFGSFGRSWVLLWHFLRFFRAVGPRILNPDDALFVRPRRSLCPFSKAFNSVSKKSRLPMISDPGLAR
jgi:hypothetical protein